MSADKYDAGDHAVANEGDLRLFMKAGAIGLEIMRAWMDVKDPAVLEGRATIYRCFQLGYLAGLRAEGGR